MRSKRFDIATVTVDGGDVRIKYGDLLVAQHDNRDDVDWECVLVTFDAADLDRGAYRVAIVTLDGREISGDAIVVRSVEGTHILRGAGPLAGLVTDDLHG